jgi:hypothetical protein
MTANGVTIKRPHAMTLERALHAIYAFMQEQNGRGRVSPFQREAADVLKRHLEDMRRMRPQMLNEVKQLAVRAQFERESG